MVRAGQSSEKAALIYQHSDEDRQREVAAGLTTSYAPSVRSTTPTTARTTGRSHRRANGAVVVRHPLTGLDSKEPPGR